MPEPPDAPPARRLRLRLSVRALLLLIAVIGLALGLGQFWLANRDPERAVITYQLRTLADRGDPRPLRLVYGNRCWDNVVFREEIDALKSRVDLTVVHVLQEVPPDWLGSHGVLGESNVRRALWGTPGNAVYFVCGPKPMCDSVQRTLRKLGVPMRRVRCELFDMA